MMLETVKKLIAAETPFEIPWSTTLQTIDSERICILSTENGSDDYPIFCLIDYGTEVGTNWYTGQGEYDVGVPSGDTLTPIKK